MLSLGLVDASAKTLMKVRLVVVVVRADATIMQISRVCICKAGYFGDKVCLLKI